MKIKLNSDDNLPLNKPLKFHNMAITIRSVFEENGKLYPQVFLDNTLYELKAYIQKCQNTKELIFQKGLMLVKEICQKECDICHYWYFKDVGFKCEPYLCNGCHDLMEKAMSFNNIVIVYIKGSAYRIHFWYMSKDDELT